MAKILIVIPHDRFRDEEFQSVYDAVVASDHTVQIGSSHHTEAHGHFGLVVKPDVNIGFVEPKDYDAAVFIGGHGVEEYLLDSSIINLIRSFSYDRKLIAAIGLAVELLVYAGILSGRKVTCVPELIEKVQGTGAYYSGMPTEIDGDILTGTDYRVSTQFAEDLVKALDYVDPKRGLR